MAKTMFISVHIYLSIYRFMYINLSMYQSKHDIIE